MAKVSRFTPLAQMTAVVLDTETTGLDVACARVVQISAVRFEAGRVLRDQTFDTLINPGVPIPPRSTAVHRITDAAVAEAPRFDAVKPALERFLDGAVVVGQSIGFDLAVLLREMQRIGERWQPPRFLDTKLLAAALDPEARELGLDALAARLGVDISDRHQALGDALVTAEVLAQLLPQLASAGIRTLADAEAHSNAQMRIRARQAAEGWYDATSLHSLDAYESGRETPSLQRLDTFPYRHRIEHVMSRPPLIVPPATPLLDAVRLMVEQDASALLAGDAAAGRADGIVTQRDVLRALAARGASALDEKLEMVMSAPVVALPRDAFLYRAVARMQRLGVQHLAVEDAGQRIVGLLSLRGLVSSQAADALVLGDELSNAHSPRQLAIAHAKLPPLTRHLLADGVDPHEIASVISVELHELLGRAAAQAERRMESRGDGRPPVPYALLAVGRAGRGECLLVPDLEHAIVFESGDASGFADQWFAALAEQLVDVLREADLAPCDGAASAVQPTWRQSLDGWRAVLTGWAEAPEPGTAAAVRFLDFNFVYGDADLAGDLRDLSLDLAAGSPALVRALMPAAPGAPDPSTRLDVGAGLAAIEAAARALAVAARITARATAERLAEAVGRTGISQATADDLIEKHQLFLAAVLEQQQADAADGVAPSYRVDSARLGESPRRALLSALEHTSRIRDMVRYALALV